MSGVPSLEHLIALSDDVGVAQHATYDLVNRNEGYCTDDVARALIVALLAARHVRQRPEALRLARTYLAFLHHAQRPDGRLRNFMSYARTWLDDAGTPDSNGRAMWALGFANRFAPRDTWRRLGGTMLDAALPQVAAFEYPRSRAYAALGLAHAFEAGGRRSHAYYDALRALGNDFAARAATASRPGWTWFEDAMTYDNARLCEAVLRIGTVLEDPTLVELGLRAFAFYESIVVEGGTFVPIGNAGWYARGEHRARYAQQPLEAASFVDAALAALAVTGDGRFRALAACGLAWYDGRNSRGTAMAHGGGCYDGLEEVGVNPNMGAESTLAYLASAFALAPAGAAVVEAR